MPPEKRWRPVGAPPSNAEVTVEVWKTHPRLQKHVRRFQDSRDPGRVLSRYVAQAQNVKHEKLLRIAVHVGAWVALLPLEQAVASPSGGEEDGSRPSPVQLLAQILLLRGRAKITDWLQGVLHLVALRLQDVRHNVQGKAAVPWMELRRSMPRAIWRELRTQHPAIPVCGESKEQQELADQGSLSKRKMPPEQSEIARAKAVEEAESEFLQQVGGPGTEDLTASDFHREIREFGSEKAVRRFYRDGAAFCNFTLEERDLHLDSLEDRLVKVVASESWDQVCSLIREAAAALAAPRQKAALKEAAVHMPEDARERLQANLQGRLRKLICQGLGCLDLSDAGTASQLEPALLFMKLLIERCKIRGQLEEARAAKQWLRLQGLLTAEATTLAQASLKNLEPGGNVGGRGGGLKTTKDGVYTPNPKIQSNPLVQNTGIGVILTCNKCGVELKSSWVFARRRKVLTLIPEHGHLPHGKCGGKYVPVDETIPTMGDNPAYLDVCPHGGPRRQCVRCGGSQICAHKKRVSRCPLCKPAGSKKGVRKARS
ncbi:unnamed protein product, partial [Polarella glacialis]